MAGVNRVCLMCGNCFTTTGAEVRRGGGKYCCRECYHKSRIGKRSPNWRGGKKTGSGGYVEIYKPNHQNADCMGYIKEHRLVMSEELGRPLLSTELVHHINENRADNRIENLALMNIGDHISHHHSGKRVGEKTRLLLSRIKKKNSCFIKRKPNGQFLGGVSYGR